MHTLRILGGAHITGPDGSALSGPVAQPRRLAFLAALAVAAGPVAREKLLALLWPESAPDRARHLLSDNVYVVNRELAGAPVQVAGGTLRLDPASMTSDVAAFEDALERGDLEAAVRSYGGPFLDGFHLRGSYEFDQWTRGERERLERSHRQALRSLAERAADPETAVAWWRRLVTSDPYDSRWRLGLMEALAGAGDRAGALAEARAHAAILATEFEAGADPAVEALADRIRTANGPAETPAEAPASRPVRQPAAPARSRAGALALVGIGLALPVFLLLARPGGSGSPPGGTPPRVAVLPFEALGGDDRGLAAGMTYDVVTRLSQMAGLSVLAPTSVERYDRGSRPPIDEALGATHVLDGAVQRAGARVRINVRMADARTGESLWAERYDRDLADVFAIQSEVAGRVASALRTTLSPDERWRVERRLTDDLEAYVLYVQGRHLWNERTRESHERAIGLFQRALERDPTFAAAYSGLADAHFLLALSGHDPGTNYAASERAARRALALDPFLAEAHTSMSMTEGRLGDWRAAGRSLERAIELNPSYATARQWYAHHLARVGRIDEAVAEIQSAHDLDPLSIAISLNLARMRFYAHDYPGAIAALERVLELEPGSVEAHLRLGAMYGQAGRWAEARRHLIRVIETHPVASRRADARAELAVVEARAGRQERGRALAKEAEADGASPFLLALAYVALDEPDVAFRWLDRVDWKYSVRGVRADPRLDRLRGDPRFTALSRRIDREFGS